MHDFSSLIVGGELCRVIDIWPEVQSILENSRLDSVVFTERVFENEKIPLYLPDEAIGLYYPVDGEDKVMRLLSDLGTSNFAHDASLDPEGWTDWRILFSDYHKVIAIAKSIVGRGREPASDAGFLDTKNPRYAPKLAAAVRAWEAVTNTGGKHPKQALAQWLREHATDFGMTDDEGRPNETGIEEVAKVANWRPSGGAPKTPGE